MIHQYGTRWDDTDREKPNNSEKTVPMQLYPTWTERGKNQGLCGEKSAINHLSYGTAKLRLENFLYKSLKMSEKQIEYARRRKQIKQTL
jgi:hypothetical protein